MDNVILCGFMGCGKSTVGKLLARMLKMEYIDLDAAIEEAAGKPIPRIFSEDGEAAFRELEHRAVAALSRRRRCVVSTGGGAMTVRRNVEAVSPEDTVVFLDADFATCYRRIKNSSRPLVRQNTRAELEALFERRRGLYQSAAAVTADASVPPAAAAESIAGMLLSKKSEPV